jgi:hypothetical protein
MATREGWIWLRNEHKRRRADLRSNMKWYRSWQPRQKRRLDEKSLRRMTAREFQGVLLEWHQERWRGLARLTGRIASTEAWAAVRRALVVVTDESLGLAARLDHVRPSDGHPPAPHLSKAVITACLHLIAPDRYCVWNGTAESGMKLLGLWPSFPRACSFSERYLLINAAVADCARSTGLSLPLLDVLWYHATQELGTGLGSDEDDAAGTEGGDLVTQLRTKRDAGIVRKAKARWSAGGTISPTCVVCGWSMEDIYGAPGFGIIEAHHNDPLANAAEARITRVSDLSPVCPNCHVVLHCSEPSIAELRRQVRRRGMTRH